MKDTYKKTFTEYLASCNFEALLLDEEFADAIVGIAHQFTKSLPVYDVKKILEIMMKKWDVSEEEAYDWYEYNMQGAYVGENTPLFLERIDDIIQ
tara:strand:- start:222 stop:506 length:285 start_codon:yes stop_codon:yes gene_type:complete